MCRRVPAIVANVTGFTNFETTLVFTAQDWAYHGTRFLKSCRPTWELNSHYTRQFHQQIFYSFSWYTECEHSLSLFTFTLEERKAQIPSLLLLR